MLLIGLFVAGCSSPAPTSAPAAASSPVPTSAPAAKAATTAPAAAQPAAAKPGGSSFNVAQVFPAGPGRELVLQNCTSCHTIVPIVTGKKARGQWDVIKQSHSGRVTAMSRDDVNTIFNYLADNFGPDNPEPQLPPELLESGTSK
jgi:mono/diheme cytochrome c family protein